MRAPLYRFGAGPTSALAKSCRFWHEFPGIPPVKESRAMIQRLILLSSAATVIGAAQTHAAAQDNADDDRGAKITISLGSTYDTNRLRLEEGVAPPPGGSEDDLINEAEAELDLAYSAGLQRFFLGGSVGYAWHRDNSFLDNERIDLLGGVDWGLTSRCGGILSARYERKLTDLADLEAVIDNTRETQTYLGTAGCWLRSNVYAELEGEFVDSTNSTSAQRGDDLQSTGFGGRLNYKPNANMTLGLHVRDTEIDYVNLGGPETGIFLIEATADRKFGNSIRVDAALGHSDAEPGSGPLTPDFEGATGHLYVDLMPSNRFTLSSNFDRNIGYSSDVSADFFLRDRIRLSAEAELTPIISIELSGRHIERDFYANGNFRTLGRSYDETDTIGAALNYRLRKRLKLTTGVEHLDRETDGLTGTYNATRMFISLGVTP